MEFAPAGELIGTQHRVRTVELRDSPQLPDGAYTFLDMYCLDPSCDCRRTLIQVLHNGVHVSTIGFGWESPEFYYEWMGGDYGDASQMSEATIDLTSPNRVPGQAMLAFFKALLDERWIGVFKSNYQAMKAALAKPQKSRKAGKRRK